MAEMGPEKFEWLKFSERVAQSKESLAAAFRGAFGVVKMTGRKR